MTAAKEGPHILAQLGTWKSVKSGYYEACLRAVQSDAISLSVSGGWRAAMIPRFQGDLRQNEALGSVDTHT